MAVQQAGQLLSLQQICLANCMNNLKSLLIHEKGNDDNNSANERRCFPFQLSTELCNDLLLYFFQMQIHLNDELITVVMQLFNDYHRTRLSRLVMKHDFHSLQPWMLNLLCNHPLERVELSLVQHEKRTKDNEFNFYNLFGPLMKLKNCLKVLVLRFDSGQRNRKYIMGKWIHHTMYEGTGALSSEIDPSLEFPNLVSLTLKNANFAVTVMSEEDKNEQQHLQPEQLSMKTCKKKINKKIREFFSKLKLFTNLVRLDLTGTYMHSDGYFFLESCKRLTSLVLTDVHDDMTEEHSADDGGFIKMMQSIVKIKTLRHLDLSSNFSLSYVDLTRQVEEEALARSGEFLTWILNELQNLVSLELANTTLAECLLKLSRESEEVYKRRCPLMFIRKFEYLGLMGSRVMNLELLNCSFPYHLLNVQKLPGKETEDQLVTAAKCYYTRPTVMVHVLDHIRWAVQNREFNKGMEVIMEVLSYLQQANDVRSAWPLVYTILHTANSMGKLDQVLREQSLQTILVNLERSQSESVNKFCLASLTVLSIPSDAICCSLLERLIKYLLMRLQRIDVDGTFINKIVMRLLHNICRYDYKEKQIAVKLGVLKHLYDVIEKTMMLNLPDQADSILIRAWSCLWSLTDEMQENCHLILKNPKAMQLFFGCTEKFGNQQEILRKMTGVMANISEVVELHPLLMTHEFVSFFMKHLQPGEKNTDVSYHIAGILSHLAIDGPETWVVESFSRPQVLSMVYEVVITWDVSVSLKIKYRSLLTIIKLLQVYDVPEAQLWATWALCNLIKVKPDFYIPMMIREKGFPVLEELSVDTRPLQESRDLAREALTAYKIMLRSDDLWHL